MQLAATSRAGMSGMSMLMLSVSGSCGGIGEYLIRGRGGVRVGVGREHLRRVARAGQPALLGLEHLHLRADRARVGGALDASSLGAERGGEHRVLQQHLEDGGLAGALDEELALLQHELDLS